MESFCDLLQGFSIFTSRKLSLRSDSSPFCHSAILYLVLQPNMGMEHRSVLPTALRGFAGGFTYCRFFLYRVVGA